jgi:hypothetical protein
MKKKIVEKGVKKFVSSAQSNVNIGAAIVKHKNVHHAKIKL